MAGSYASEPFAWWDTAGSTAPQVHPPNLRPEPVPEPPAPGPDQARASQERTLQHLKRFRTLGILQALGHEGCHYYEFKFLNWVHRILTVDWAIVQGGTLDGQANVKWIEICRTLELDRKSSVDLFLLAHQGRVGRSEANEILWFLLSDAALQEPYRDLSNLCSSKVGQVRYKLDRPGPTHHSWTSDDPWRWSNYDHPRNPNFSPLAVPPGPTNVVRGHRGIPLNPPQRWRPVPLPKEAPPLAARPKTL